MMTENEQKMLNNFLTFLKMPINKDLHLDKLYWSSMYPQYTQ